MLKDSDGVQDYGLFILRAGFGLLFIVHGWPKIVGGPELWTGLGGAMGSIGIHFLPEFWGFMAALSEFGGGVLLIAGMFTRTASLLMLITMSVASVNHLATGDGVAGASHALKTGIVFLYITITGPGKLSADRFWRNRMKKGK
ncbi:MAG: DoxX family protein [Chitinivibrionales bacterium]